MPDQSQHGETSWVLENLKPAAGIFCEVGAFDGIMSSNTLLLEELGWFGICIEADPFLAAKCHVNRGCKSLCCAVGDPLKQIPYFHINHEDRGLSGFKRESGQVIPVVVARLDSILCKRECPDFLSIDTEGTELEVWDTIGDMRPKIVIMEYKTCDEPPNDAAIVERMTRDGYKEVHRTPCNIIFTR